MGLILSRKAFQGKFSCWSGAILTLQLYPGNVDIKLKVQFTLGVRDSSVESPTIMLVI